MSSIIERPWSEDGFQDICSGRIKYETTTSSEHEKQSSRNDSYTTLQGSEFEHPVNLVFGRNAKEAAEFADRFRRCDICDTTDHWMTDCSLLFSVPKGAYVSPFFMIICDLCGSEMKNDLLCPDCKIERQGRILSNLCQACGETGVDHKADSCPNKDKPIDEPDEQLSDIDFTSDYEPSSP